MNPLQAISNFLLGTYENQHVDSGKVYGEKFVKTKPGLVDQINALGELLGLNKSSEIGTYQAQEPSPSPVKGYKTEKSPTPSLTPLYSPQPTPSMANQPWSASGTPDQELVNRINEGYAKYHSGTLPASQYSPVFAEFAQRSPLFQQNPYLMPLIAILETSGGLNMTRPKQHPINLINYGANSGTINSVFSDPNMTTEEALRRSLYEMSQPGSAYSQFETGAPLNKKQLQQFADIFEPNNKDYYRQLVAGLKDFWGIDVPD